MKNYETMKSEELVNEIQVISGVLAGRTFGEEQEVESVEETIEHEGLVLRKVEREARKGDYIRPLMHHQGSALNVKEIHGPVNENMSVGNRFDDTDTNEYRVYESAFNRRRETIEVFEVVALQDNGQLLPWESVPLKTANQQRAELIQRAREFWDANADDDFHCEVDKEKRTVFVYKVVSDGPKYSAITGLAICRTDEVFNEWIGMAIALARALEIDVPEEFLNAVQPDMFAVGQVTRLYCGTLHTITRIEQHKARLCNDGFHWFRELNDGTPLAVTITDDTNAEYETAT